ncbi:MAG: GTPase HflX, partial [Clostridiales bacterium]|nr:GTPase HflX [Clostridiales bacterium]
FDSTKLHSEYQMMNFYDTLKDLGCAETPVITAFNKMDREVELPLPKDSTARTTVRISASSGDGMDELLNEIERVIKSFKKKIKVLVPYSEGKLMAMVYAKCEITHEEHREDGVLVELYANEEMENRLEKYTVLKEI